MFAHRNTENINKHLYRFKSSEVINSTLNLMGLIIISLKKDLAFIEVISIISKTKLFNKKLPN